jgi:hypothetical protein
VGEGNDYCFFGIFGRRHIAHDPTLIPEIEDSLDFGSMDAGDGETFFLQRSFDRTAQSNRDGKLLFHLVQQIHCSGIVIDHEDLPFSKSAPWRKQSAQRLRFSANARTGRSTFSLFVAIAFSYRVSNNA